jgi:hypothetical protein
MIRHCDVPSASVAYAQAKLASIHVCNIEAVFFTVLGCNVDLPHTTLPCPAVIYAADVCGLTKWCQLCQTL